MRELLKQINDIQQQLNELQADVISMLPAMEFASELFAERNMSEEEALSNTTVAPAAKAETIAFSAKAAAEKATKETKSVAKRKLIQKGLKQDDIKPANAETAANVENLIDRTKEILSSAAEPVTTEPVTPEPAPVEQPASATITYDDFKNSIYSFIKENTAVNKPIVLNIFKERGYGFTSDVPEADYKLVLDIIRPTGE